MKQGRVHSTWFFNVYIRELIIRLRESGFSCFMASVYIGCILFANDILLLSASIVNCQSTLTEYSDFDTEFDIKLNQFKSFVLQVWLGVNINLLHLILRNAQIKVSRQLKFLGISINAGKNLAAYTDIIIIIIICLRIRILNFT